MLTGYGVAVCGDVKHVFDVLIQDRSHVNNIRLICRVIVVMGLVNAISAWAQEGQGDGGSQGGGDQGGGHHDGGGHHGGGGHAHHGGYHNHGGIGFYNIGGFYPGFGFGGYGLGLGYYGGYGFGMPYYSRYTYPPMVAAPPAPTVYIQQQQQAAVESPPRAQTDYWHYCRKPEGYYPYIKNCPDGWMQVVPQLKPNS